MMLEISKCPSPELFCFVFEKWLVSLSAGIDCYEDYSEVPKLQWSSYVLIGYPYPARVSSNMGH
jgi:hypothetical protein